MTPEKSDTPQYFLISDYDNYDPNMVLGGHITVYSRDGQVVRCFNYYYDKNHREEAKIQIHALCGKYKQEYEKEHATELAEFDERRRRERERKIADIGRLCRELEEDY